MKKTVFVLTLVFLMALASCLTGCSSGGTTLKVYNWEDYIDPSVIEDFTKETGIKVNDVRFTTNEDMYIKLTRGGGNYDVIFPSDYMIERLISENRLEKLDHSKLPEMSNLMDWLQSPQYDLGNAHSVPYMWGTVGILYNIEKTGGEIDSWGALWDTKYQRDVYMMDSIRDSMGVTLKYLGHSFNTTDRSQLEAARDKLIEQKRSGVLLAYGVDEIKDKLENNECAMGLVWSGDALTTMAKNDKLRYCLPKEGSNIWADAICIPKGSKNIDAAYQFINYLLSPEIAARNSEYIGYSTPNEAALEILGSEYADDPVFNPPPEDIARCEFFHDVKDMLPVYESLWTEVKTAK